MTSTPSSFAPGAQTGPLRRLRDGLSLAQIVIAVVAVAMAHGVSTPSLITFGALVSIAWWRPRPATGRTTDQRAWTALVFVALVATLVRAIVRAEFLDAGVDFLLLLVVQRMFNRQRSREHAQLLMLGALMMVVGAVINTEVSYPVLLAAYLLLTTMALMVNNLMAEGERLGDRVMLQLSHEGHIRRRSLWRAAAGVATLAAVGAQLTFLMFPRWGVGVFLRGRLPTQTRSGFADEVKLGGFGTIKDDPTVVMRVRPTRSPRTATTSWYLRGSSFDRYQGGRWRHDAQTSTESLQPSRGYQSMVDGRSLRLPHAPLGRALRAREIPGFAQSSHTATASIILEDIGTDILLIPTTPVAIKVIARGPLESQARALGGRNDEIRVSKLPGPVQYEVVWRSEHPTRSELAAQLNPPLTPPLQPYVQRSPDLSPEITALAKRLVADAPRRIDQVDAIMRHLQGFRYTLEQPVSARVRNDGVDPIEGFLFDTQAGHCEYYATAMAILLRELSIPARIVNGYYGAHYNAVGDFYAVRQADAHSWVEVHFGALGWITFDPTPMAGRVAGNDAPRWPAMTELQDALRNAYLEYVIDYDLTKQFAILEGLGLHRRSPRPRGLYRGVLIGVVMLAAGLWLVWRIRSRLSARRTIRPETRLLLDLLEHLNAAGFPNTPAQSPQQIAKHLRLTKAPGALVMQQFVERYDTLRFGPPGPGHASSLEQLRADYRQIKYAIDHHRAP